MFFLFFTSFDSHNCMPKITEYLPRTDADLIQVQVVTRHGARTPLHLSKEISNIWECQNSELNSNTGVNTGPIHVSVSFGRSYFLGNCHFSQLLETGVEGLKEVGRYLRKVYVEKIKFLPSSYDSSVCYFRTTDTLRTIHSQMSLFRGLYPGTEKLEIHTADKIIDPWKQPVHLCPTIAKIQRELVGGSEWIEANLNDEVLMNETAEILGVKWSSVNDAVTSTLCRGYKLPSNMTEEKVDAAIKLKARQMQFLYSHDSFFPLYSSFTSAEMLNEMLLRVSGASRRRFIHWSAHDANVLGLLGFLGYSDDKWPPYGSFITIELFRFRRLQQFFVQFRYNGKLLRIPRFSYSRVIPLDDFTKFVRNFMPSLEEECGFNITSFRQKMAV